jgi:hypothetical protein
MHVSTQSLQCHFNPKTLTLTPVQIYTHVYMYM